MPGPRLNHKKSRNGCQRCKTRRVKCDEAQPVCGSCHRHSVSCVYGSWTQRARPVDESPSTASAPESISHNPDVMISHPNLDATGDVDLPESADRRRFELRLLHHYIVRTSATFPATHNAQVRAAWTIDVPQLANRHPSLLYALLSVAALHLSKIEPHDLELKAAYRRYLDLALVAHRRALDRFDPRGVETSVDAVCFTSVLIILGAFAELQDRVPGQEYDPPMQWLGISLGVGKVFRLAWPWIKDDSTAAVVIIVRSAPILSDHDSLFSESNRQEFAELLMPLRGGSPDKYRENNEELDDKDTREAYEKTVSYIGSINKAVRGKEHSLTICRLLLAFAVVVPQKMPELVEKKKPRALVVLAHYFALAGPIAGDMEAVWWIGPIARKEVEGIQRCLPDEWQDLMRWPLAITTEIASER